MEQYLIVTNKNTCVPRGNDHLKGFLSVTIKGYAFKIVDNIAKIVTVTQPQTSPNLHSHSIENRSNGTKLPETWAALPL